MITLPINYGLNFASHLENENKLIRINIIFITFIIKLIKLNEISLKMNNLKNYKSIYVCFIIH
jgi:hypothetical protein